MSERTQMGCLTAAALLSSTLLVIIVSLYLASVVRGI